MAIMFHCEHCGRKIEAKDNAGGKWGRCPACHNKVYVPDPNADGDLKLAPIDEEAERRERELMAETYQITQAILQEREMPESPAVPLPHLNDADLTNIIITYLRQLADGELEQAEENENLIVAFGNRALQLVDKIAVSDLQQPELADIPPQVLAGLIRNLRSKLSSE